MTGPPSSTRRRFLRLAGVGTLGLAGCTARSPGTDETTGTPSSTTTSTTTSEPLFSDAQDVDERVQKTPPGSPPLDVSGAWPSFRFDAANTGYNPDGTGVRDGTTYWRLNAGAAPSVVDGALYNFHGRSEDCAGLTRRDPATMSRKSCTELVEYGTNSPPTVAGERVFVTTFIEVFCLSPTLDVEWRGPKMDGIHGTPTVADGTVFVNSAGFKSVSPQLRAFDAATGGEQWRYDTGSVSKSTPAVADGTVFVVARDGLHAVDAASGEKKFVVADAADEWATPAVADGTVYAVIDDDELLAIDAEDGTTRWRATAGGMDSAPPVVTDDVVFVGTENGIVGLDPEDGEKVTDIGTNGVPVAGIGDTLYSKREGTLYAADAVEGRELWSQATREVQVTDMVLLGIGSVVPVDGGVYVNAADAFYGIGPAEQ